MSRLPLCFAILAPLLLGSCVSDPGGDGPPPPGGTELQGSIEGVLAIGQSPFLVVQDVYVDSLSTLTIEQGVNITFHDSTSLKVFGAIHAVGAASTPINFTGLDNTWFGIEIVNSPSGNVFQFCNFNRVFISDPDISEFGALTINNSRATITNCVFQHNSVMNGGGMSVIDSDVDVMNNVFMDNHAVTFGGAIIAIRSQTRIHNNTFFHNSATNYGGGVVLIDPVFDDVQNNIFYLNSGQTGDPRISIQSGDSTQCNSQFNFMWQESMNPRFVSDNNVRLLWDSPCVDQGNPQADFNDADGSRNDQGAYGGPGGDW